MKRDALSPGPSFKTGAQGRTRNARLVRAATLIAAGLIASSLTFAQTPEQPTQLVDDLNGLFGKQAHHRAVHAKGIVATGQFMPSKEAPELSRARHFQRGPVAVTVRFSDFAGIPLIPDTDAMASPRGMAIKFALDDGSTTDLVCHSFNGFPTATASEFGELLRALASSGAAAVKPTALDKFLDAHPAARNFLAAPKPPPVSYATVAYFCVNAFKFVTAGDKTSYVRLRLVPAAGEHALSGDAVSHASVDYLSAELKQRLATGAIGFDLVAQLAQPGDKIDDPSIAWPDARPMVMLGRIQIVSLVPDSALAEQKLMFLPLALPDGIEAADPMLKARNAAYPVSYARRNAAAD